MKEKIEETLNSSITAYANKTRNNYKMPRFTEEDWNKVYNNISVISFVQGMNIGFKNYNNYCILNSTNNQEYVNPNLIYFTDGDSYHDIRCQEITATETIGYKIGSFEKQSYEYEEETIAEDGSTTTETKTGYYYKHNELACYECVNGTLSANEGKNEIQNIYDYVRNASTSDTVKIAYFSALARERHNTIKLLNSYNAEYTQKYTVTYISGEVENAENVPETQTENIGIPIVISNQIPIDPSGNKTFSHWESSTGGTYYPSTDEVQSTIKGFNNITLTAIWNDNFKIRFYNNYTNSDNDYEEETKIYSENYIITKTITREGYNFLGWNTERDGSGDTYDIGSIYTGNQNLNLYAQWEMKVILTSISASLNKNTYYYNIRENISEDNISVTAYYSDNSSKSVQNFSFTPTTIESNTNKITISYTEEGITKTTQVNIEVKRAVASVTRSNTITYYESLAKAISAAGNGDTVTILEKIDLKTGITINKSIKLTGGTITTDKSIEISTGKNVTLDNITINGTGIYHTIYNYGTLTISSGSYTSQNNNAVYSSGTLTITGGTFTANGDQTVIGIGNGTAKITSGTINISKKNNNNGWNCGIWISAGSLNISGVNFGRRNTNRTYDIYKARDAEVKTNGNNYTYYK